MTHKTQQRYWLYHTGLLETLTFSHERKLYWFQSVKFNNRFVYSDYFTGDEVPSFLKGADLT